MFEATRDSVVAAAMRKVPEGSEGQHQLPSPTLNFPTSTLLQQQDDRRAPVRALKLQQHPLVARQGVTKKPCVDTC